MSYFKNSMKKELLFAIAARASAVHIRITESLTVRTRALIGNAVLFGEIIWGGEGVVERTLRLKALEFLEPQEFKIAHCLPVFILASG